MSKFTLYDENGNVIEDLHQWDHDITVTVKGIDGARVSSIQFANYASSLSEDITPIVVGEGVRAGIPNYFFWEAATLFLYVYENVGEKGQRTTHKISIPVESRPKPADYVYTETEVKTWSAFEEKMFGQTGDIIAVLKTLSNGITIKDTLSTLSNGGEENADY